MTLIYVLVAFVAIRAVPVAKLAETDAPISLMFEELTGLPPFAINLIAIMATMNGVVIILIMAARVAYGMAREGRLPSWLGKVSARTRTPVRATLLVTVAVLLLALFTPLDVLAETTSVVMLSVFLMVNLALVRLKMVRKSILEVSFAVPIIVPLAGALSCVGLLVGALLWGA